MDVLGFAGADDFELVTLTPKSGSSGTAEAMVRATHGGVLPATVDPAGERRWNLMLNGIQEEVKDNLTRQLGNGPSRWEGFTVSKSCIHMHVGIIMASI